MIEIDGSQGEGGGQMVRSSLALSAMTGKPLRLQNIRGGRAKPGLLRQHLTGLEAMTAICNAEVSGGSLGSKELTFCPSSIQGGRHSFQVGSAGSAVLVAQTILPALLMANQPSTITIGGGTHAAWAPPFDFFERCFLPLLGRMNAQAVATLHAHGFYPAGGGEIEMQVTPCGALAGLELVNRQGQMNPRVMALVSKIPVSVGERECETIRRKTQWSPDCFEVIPISRSAGPGNAVMIQCEFDNVSELFLGLGQVGLKAEHVARSVLGEARAYLASNVPVGQYLADQLLMPMGLAAHQGQVSRFRTVPLSLHSQTHIAILKRFLNIEIDVFQDDDTATTVIVRPMA
jgi:RNA 3'-terminal phosphate cyclase (ATP)